MPLSDKQFDTYLRRQYSITLEDYNAVLSAQQGRCYVCRRRSGRIRLGVDHNHRTGEVRGLLCVRSHRDANGRDYPACNRIIGMARDDPAFFDRAARYLREPPARAILEQRQLDRATEALTVTIECDDYDMFGKETADD